MSNEEIEVSPDRLSAIVPHIVDKQEDNEPFLTPEEFWRSGFHPRAFSWLFRELEYVVRLRTVSGNDDPATEFQRRLNGDVAKMMGDNNEGELRTKRIQAFVLDSKWCDYPRVRKAVLCLLFKHSFPLLGTTGKLEYPKWLPGEWAKGVTPEGIM